MVCVLITLSRVSCTCRKSMLGRMRRRCLSAIGCLLVRKLPAMLILHPLLIRLLRLAQRYCCCKMALLLKNNCVHCWMRICICSVACALFVCTAVRPVWLSIRRKVGLTWAITVVRFLPKKAMPLLSRVLRCFSRQVWIPRPWHSCRKRAGKSWCGIFLTMVYLCCSIAIPSN